MLIHNKETGEISFDINQVPEAERNNAMLYLSLAIQAKEKYLFNISTIAEGINRDDKTTKTSAPLIDGEHVNLEKAATNLSITPRGEEDKKNYTGTKAQWDRTDALPPDGFDAVITLSPFTQYVYDVAKPDEESIGIRNDYTDLHNHNKVSLFFHELVESYERTTNKSSFDCAHSWAYEVEKSLPIDHAARSKNIGKKSPVIYDKPYGKPYKK